jgi:Protein of unknown function (DUF4232)
MLAAAVVALGAAAALSVYAGLAGSSSTDTQSSGGRAFPSASRCRSDQLRLTAPKMWGAAAGSLIDDLTLTNASHASCSVAGWPAVRVLDRRGRPIPAAIQRWFYKQRAPAPFRVVRLRPGASATFPVVGQDWNHAADRACPDARTVRVEPPNGGGWLSIARKIPACGRWDVGPLVPGRQAPWPSFALSEFHAANAEPSPAWDRP